MIQVETKIIRRIVKEAIEFMEYDDAHPNIGFGTFAHSAVDDAIEEMHKDAKFFGVTVTITDKMREKAIKEVQKIRENR